MNLFAVSLAKIIVFLLVFGSGIDLTGSTCHRFWWNVVGNHYDGGNCEGEVQDVQPTYHPKARLTKRDEGTSLSANPALNTISNLMNIVNSNLNLKVETDPRVMCKTCRTGIQMVRIFIGLSKSDEDTLKLATSLCVELKIMTEDICEGLVRINGPPIIHILKTSDMSPLDICSFLMKTDCEDVKNPNLLWSVLVPELLKDDQRRKPTAKSVSKPFLKERPKLKVLHISDTHFDPYYQEDTWAECSVPLCCRDEIGEPAENATKGGPWGGWKCDIPERTLDDLLEHINKQHPDIDYVLWTGDIPPHDSWSLYRNDSLDILNRTLSKMMKHFPNVPVYPALGNHESVPPNLFPPSTVAGDEWAVDWLYEKLEESWRPWLDENSTKTIRKGAFYVKGIRPDLKIVSLNMNYCYYHNWWLILDSEDPMEELKWLVGVLEEAERNHEKVHIIGHIPPGYSDCLKVWQQNYYDIIKRFSNTVTAQFFGHTHNDEFELFYDKKDFEHPHSVAYVGPSVTTYTYLNPGYRIYYIDGDHEDTTRMVTDHETWVMDLEESNRQNSTVWYKLYSAKDAYNMTDLTPQDWHDFFRRLQYDEDLLDLYHKHYWKNSPRRPPCDESCKTQLLCDIRSCDLYGRLKDNP